MCHWSYSIRHFVIFLAIHRTEEPSLYEGLFIAKDNDVLAFVENVRGSSRARVSLNFVFCSLFIYHMWVNLSKWVTADFTGRWQCNMWGVKVQGEQGDIKEIFLQNRWRGFTGGCLQVCWFVQRIVLYSAISDSCIWMSFDWVCVCMCARIHTIGSWLWIGGSEQPFVCKLIITYIVSHQTDMGYYYEGWTITVVKSLHTPCFCKKNWERGQMSHSSAWMLSAGNFSLLLYSQGEFAQYLSVDCCFWLITGKMYCLYA